MTEESPRSSLWNAAIRDAAGVLASFITPEQMSLATLSVTPTGVDPTSEFVFEIQRRLDLGRAMRLTELADDLSNQLTSVYRHQVTVSVGALNGKLHIPSYAREIAHGRPDHFPVIRATRVIHTPENLLLSEAVRLSLTVARVWAHQAGAEGKTANSLLQRLTRTEARHPWAELRNIPRPPISTLIPVVRGRAVAGIISPDSPVLGVCDLFGNENGNAIAFDASASALAFAATTNSRFADRLFELLCLAWIVDGLRMACRDSEIVPSALRTDGYDPIMTASNGKARVRVFFQTGRPLGPKRWRNRATLKPLAAIPDIVVEISFGSKKQFVIVDAKNRPKSSDSSVAYKMLGYRENLSVQPFSGVAVFPATGFKIIRRTLVRGPDQLFLVRLPLQFGRRIVRQLVRQVLTS